MIAMPKSRCLSRVVARARFALIALSSITYRRRTRTGIAEHSLSSRIEVTSFDDRLLSAIEAACVQHNGCLSACNTVAHDMLGTAALRQLAAACLNDTSSAGNAYPAFWVLSGASTSRSLALFVHRNASFSAGKTTKHRLASVKTTRKRKQSETVSRCGICAG
ncbi:hypothetical protein [Bradyrhizobium sp. USDA 3364]